MAKTVILNGVENLKLPKVWNVAYGKDFGPFAALRVTV